MGHLIALFLFFLKSRNYLLWFSLSRQNTLVDWLVYGKSLLVTVQMFLSIFELSRTHWVLNEPIKRDTLKMTFQVCKQGLFHFFEVKRLLLVNLLYCSHVYCVLEWYLQQRHSIRWLVLIPVVVCFAIAHSSILFVKFHKCSLTMMRG